MKDRAKLSIAVVGCGQIADAHLQAIGNVPGVRAVAVCDQYSDLARQAAARFGVRGAYTDLGRLLAEASPDVVHITTPPHTHAALACQALSAGAHVYVEKPFAVNAAESERIFHTAQSAGRQVCAGHDQLFDPCWLECRARVAAGEIGRVIHVDSVMGYDLTGPFGRVLRTDANHWVHRLPGGLFHNNISHAVCKVLDLVPDDRPSVWATWFGGPEHDGTPTELRVLLKWREATAQILFSSAARPVQRVVRVYGTRRMLEVDFDGRLVRVRQPVIAPGAFAKLAVPWRDLRMAARALTRNAWRFFRSDLHYFAGMRRLFAEFYRAIREGSAVPVSPRDVQRVTALMDRIFAVCRGGEPAQPAKKRTAADRRERVGVVA
jgi:predicted dehydrogenase